MKYALIDGQRHEAEPGFAGKCPVCDSPAISKCGERRVWHWAHRGNRHCDHWWEPETEWHRAWKNKFPAKWQEVIRRANNGEKHIADVKTPHDHVIEFQHSYLRPDERRAREAIYKPMVWVVNGLRRKRDKPTFRKMSLQWRITRLVPLTFSVATGQCALLRDWIDSRVPVFFDLGVTQEDIDFFGAPLLWRLSPKSGNGCALLSPVPVNNFVEALLKGEPIKGIAVEVPKVRTPEIVRYRRPIRPPRSPNYRSRVPSLAQHLARKRRTQPRF